MPDDPFHTPCVLGLAENDLNPAKVGHLAGFHLAGVEIEGGLIARVTGNADPLTEYEIVLLAPAGVGVISAGG